ncbi:hypothetical protein [Holospora elegans]|uniref:hypothetical protein n=1 Tax=Holospora elegans TaxID=431043 RepID=UPI0019D327C1|nr:hypothetical protein [Holospora elegans]
MANFGTSKKPLKVRAPLYSNFTRGLRWIKDKLLFFDFSDLLNYLKKSEGEYGSSQSICEG